MSKRELSRVEVLARVRNRHLRVVDGAALLRRTPNVVGLSGTLWDGKTLQVWLARRYGVRLGVRQCQRMFRQSGFRLRKPRPLIAHADSLAARARQWELTHA